jgi:hypothetical protein
MAIKDHFIEAWQKYVFGLIIAASLTGLGVAADQRWLRVASFERYAEQMYQRNILEEIRALEIQINALESEIAWTDNPMKEAALQERINFLETQIHELERELDQL